jgi:hypothetical protein
LSLPDVFGNVKRHKIVTVEFMDIKWIKQKKKYKDLNAESQVEELLLEVERLREENKSLKEESK